MFPKLTPAQAAGIARMAAKGIAAGVGDVADLVKPWRWTGGKPGEVTGTMLSEQGAKLVDINRFGGARGVRGKLNAERSKMLNTAAKQIESHVNKSPESSVSTVYNALALKGYDKPERARIILSTVYQPLERAGIPRDWTGKVASVVAGKGLNIPKLSAELKSLDDAGREALLESIAKGLYNGAN